MGHLETLVLKEFEQHGLRIVVIMEKHQETNPKVIYILSMSTLVRREEIQVQNGVYVLRTLFRQLNGREENDWSDKIFYFNPSELKKYPIPVIRQMIGCIDASTTMEIS